MYGAGQRTKIYCARCDLIRRGPGVKGWLWPIDRSSRFDVEDLLVLLLGMPNFCVPGNPTADGRLSNRKSARTFSLKALLKRLRAWWTCPTRFGAI